MTVLVAGGAILLSKSQTASAQDSAALRRASDSFEIDSIEVPTEATNGDLPAGQEQLTGLINVMVELTDAPTTQVYAAELKSSGMRRDQTETRANAAAQTQLDVIQRAQSSIASVLKSQFHATEIYRVQRALNGIAVRLDAAQLRAIRNTPGVKKVHVLVLEYPTNSTSVPFLGTPQLWDNSLSIRPDLTGRNIKVGIIDTGIDYIHSNFGGTGAQTEYTANNRTTTSDPKPNGEPSFPTAKVVGGTDFAGDNYNGGNTPVPDPDPMDCNGHGTHVSGTAAGFGVNSDGTTYTGPYGTATPFSSLRIGPGTAPGADLYALRVFGCGGGTLLTNLAIEWAVDPNGDGNLSDRLDVINMSLGSNYGSRESASALASDNAALTGLIVVASAGNAGDSYFISGAPGSSGRTLSVASSIDPGTRGARLRVNSPPVIAGNKNASGAVYGPIAPPEGLTADVVLANDSDTSGPGTVNDGCQAFTNAAAVSGKLALVDRGLCSFKTKTLNAQNAGAIGVIIANNVAGLPGIGDDPTLPEPTIPTIGISQADGNAIKAQLGTGVNATLFAFTLADTLSSFSSRGPTRASFPLQLKPDIAAPGQSITSAQSGTTCTDLSGNSCIVGSATGFFPNNQILTLSGTSMAAPHMAGIMALLRQLHPDWTVEELKAASMNGAVHDLFTGENQTGTRYGPGRVGAGRTDPIVSATNTAVAFNADDSGVVSVYSFENEVVSTATGRTRTIRIVNKGTTDVSYTLAIDTVVNAPGVTFSLPGGTSLTVPAGQTRSITVQMDGVADQMDHTRDATVSATQSTQAGVQPRHYLTEESGYVTFTEGGQLKMRVPIFATPRPASDMQASDVLFTGGGPSGSTTLPLSGLDVCTGTRPAEPDCIGTFPTDVVSLVTPFELQVVDPADSNVRSDSDLRYAGVSYTGTSLLFGVATYGDWTWPRDVEFDILIDHNEDGVTDRILFNTALNVPGTNNGTDFYVARVFDVATNTLIPTVTLINGTFPNSADTVVYNNNVMFMTSTPANLGMAAGDTSFRYRIQVFDRDSAFVDDAGFDALGNPTTPFTFNFAAPGVSFPTNPVNPNNSGFLFADINGRTIPVNFNRPNLTANGSRGILLLHQHNKRGTRAEVVAVSGISPATTDLSVGLAVDNPNPPLNSNVTFTVAVNNTSSTNATNVRVLDELPPGLEYVSHTPSVGTYNPATGIWNVGALASGGAATLQIVAKVLTTDAVANTARVAGADQLDTNGANDQATVTLAAPRSADLGITLSSNVASAREGTTVNYTATVTNAGEDPANNIVVNIAFAAPGATITSSTASSGVFNPTTGVWNIASLGKNSFATLTFSITLPRTCGNLVATATVSAETADPNTMNNTATATVAVEPFVTIAFTQATYTADEGSTAVDVTVTRTCNTTSTASVDYATSDGEASSRSDYTPAFGRLEFAAGEATKTIQVLINEDSLVEGTETLNITLSNPQPSSADAELGAQATAVVQINDDATEPATNAIDDTDLFVRQHYHDFLNREGDAAGIAFWRNNIDSCGSDAACRANKRIETSAAFFLSIEFQHTGYAVYLAYQAAFAGTPVPVTLEDFLPDVQRIGRGVIIGEPGALALLEANTVAYFNEFVTRPEFTTQYPSSMTPAQFVDELNTNSGGSLSQSERDALVAELTANNTTAGRASVLRKVTDDSTFRAAEFNRAFVLMQYFGYLRRNPNDTPDTDYAGYFFWLNKLDSFNGDFRAAEMVKAFITAGEYRQRFGTN